MDFFAPLFEFIIERAEMVVPIVAVFARLSIFLYLLPGIGETSIPVRVRLGAALALTLIIVPVLMPFSAEPINLVSGTLLIVRESIFGLWLGLAFRLMIFTLQILGNIVSQALSISQVLGEGIATEPNTTLSSLFMLAGITLLMTLNLHVEAVGVFIRSYDVFPLGGMIDTDMSAYWFMQKTAAAFTFGVTLALPFIILNFIYNLIIGFLNRSMPQLMVSFVGMPAITGVGLAMLSVAAGVMLMAWARAYVSLFESLPGVVP